MQLKSVPEDFIVEEMPSFKLSQGKYSIYRLWKRDMTSEHAVDIISRKFHIERKYIKYAGSKDRQAITTQYLSIEGRQGLSIDEPDIRLDYLGQSQEPISLGFLEGNKFTITLRSLSLDEKTRMASHAGNTSMPNYFDEQRFSKSNAEIGLALLKQDFKEACALMISCGASEVKEALGRDPSNPVAAIRMLSKKIVSMYIHSVQSYIFNELLSELLRKNAKDNDIEMFERDYSMGKFVFYKDARAYDSLKDIKLPLVGFDSDASIMEKHGLKPRDFIIRQLPDLTVDEQARDAIVEIGSLECEFKDDVCVASFMLGKGSYATIAVKSMTH